ncbi:MAG: hypothetical protein BGO03_12030 [Mesorhizobium sp. 61-13]|nr:MAG: hypothetical protein BGO03_12030 [Mesorhizobium sp. 61-13]
MKTLLLASALGLFVTSAAFADTTVTATTDLNLRAGPGSQFPVVGVIGAGQTTVVKGCINQGKWCNVVTGAEDAWAYSDYLMMDSGGTQVILTQRAPSAGIAVVEAPRNTNNGDVGAVAGGVTGAIAGAIIGGPVGAAVGGAAGTVAGGAAGTVIEPPATVRTYVTSHQAEPVYLDGEVVVGAGLPETVALNEIPDYQYRYVNVNGQAVLVDAQSRKIVYIVR